MQHKETAMPPICLQATAPARTSTFSAAADEIEMQPGGQCAWHRWVVLELLCSYITCWDYMCSSLLGTAGSAHNACEDAADAVCNEAIARCNLLSGAALRSHRCGLERSGPLAHVGHLPSNHCATLCRQAASLPGCMH